MRPHQQRIAEADCESGRHAWVVSHVELEDDGDGDEWVNHGRICRACGHEQWHAISRDLFMGIKTEHLWMAPDVRLGT